MLFRSDRSRDMRNDGGTDVECKNENENINEDKNENKMENNDRNRVGVEENMTEDMPFNIDWQFKGLKRGVRVESSMVCGSTWQVRYCHRVFYHTNSHLVLSRIILTYTFFILYHSKVFFFVCFMLVFYTPIPLQRLSRHPIKIFYTILSKISIKMKQKTIT